MQKVARYCKERHCNNRVWILFEIGSLPDIKNQNHDQKHLFSAWHNCGLYLHRRNIINRAMFSKQETLVAVYLKQ